MIVDIISGILGVLVGVIIYRYVFLRDAPGNSKTIREYTEILNSSPVPTVLLDEDGARLLMMNPRASEILALLPQQQGEPIPNQIFADPEEKEDVFAHIHQFGRISDHEVAIRSRTGVVYTTLVSAIRVYPEENPVVILSFTDITRQKELEVATIKNKELYKSIIRTSPDPIVLGDTLGKIYKMSPSAFSTLGYSIREHYPYGMYCLDFIHPDDRDQAKHNLRLLKEGKNTGPNEYRAIRKDGAIIHIESHAEIVRDQNGNPDSILFIFRDITRRKEAEAIIRENEERFMTIFHEVPDPLFIVTREGMIIEMNRQCEHWFSVKKNNFIDLSLQDIRFSRSVEAEDTLVDEILNLPQGEKMETMLVLPDLTERHTIISTKSITIAGTQAILILINDIDEIKRAYQALASANNQLSLLHSITRHDILNKVMVITGYSEIMREDSTDENEAKILEVITQSGKDIQSLIEFTKEFQDLGKAKSRWQSVQQILNKPVIQSILSGIAIILPDRDMEVFADPLLEKVLYNLIENSRRHGGNVSCITISYVIEDTSCTLVYTDNGSGIRGEEKEKIFQKGFGKNTGLGLFIIREILAITGLTIRECGRAGEGVRFEIHVPEGKFRVTPINTI